MADINKIYQIILSAKDEASAVIGKVTTSLAGIEQELTAVRNASAIAFAALAAGSGFAVKAAIDAEQSMNLARASVKVAGQDFELYRNKLADTTAEMQKMTMFQDDDLQRSFAQMVSVTQDAQGSLNNLGLVADLASGRNIDLATSADLVAKAMQGNIGRLGMLFPELAKLVEALGENATQAEKAGVLIGYLTDHFKGMAVAAADSAEGGLTKLKNQLNELQEAIGGSLLGYLKDSSADIQALIEKTTEWVKENQGLVAGLQLTGLGITGLLVLLSQLGLAVIGLNAIWLKFGATIATVSGTLLATAPYFLVIAAVGGLVLSLYDLSKSSHDASLGIKELRDQLPQLADETNGLRGISEETAATIARWGKTHTEVIPQLALTKEEIDRLKRSAKEMYDIIGNGNALSQVWNETLSTSKTRLSGVADEAKRAADEMNRLMVMNLRQGQATPEEQTRNLRPQGRNANQGILPDEEFMRIFAGLDEMKTKVRELSPIAIQLAQDFSGAMGSAIGRVVNSLTSMARLTALSIRDIFRAIGEEILSLFARVLAQLIATGILKLLLSILNPASAIIPLNGGSSGWGDAFGGGGIASIPRGGGSSVPAIVNPSQSSFGGNQGGSSFALHIHGDFIGSDENISKLEKVIARRMQYGQSNMRRS